MRFNIIEDVTSYTYLGFILNLSSLKHVKIYSLIKKVRKARVSTQKLLSKLVNTVNTFLNILDSLVKPMIYSYEASRYEKLP